MKITKTIIAYSMLALVVVMYVFQACSVSSAFSVADADTSRLRERGYTATTEELKEGYSFYVKRCGNCHHLKEPGQYTTSQWQLTHLPAEFSKAKVESEKEKKLITYYIIAKSK